MNEVVVETARNQIFDSFVELSTSTDVEDSLIITLRLSAPFDNQLLNHQLRVPPKNRTLALQLIASLVAAPDNVNGGSRLYSLSFDNISSLLEGLVALETSVVRQFDVEPSDYSVYGKRKTRCKDLNVRVRALPGLLDRIESVDTMIFSPEGEVVALNNCVEIIEQDSRKETGIIWIDVMLSGGEHADQHDLKDFRMREIVEQVFPSAFLRDGHQAERGRSDYYAFDARIMTPIMAAERRFTGRVRSQKLFFFVGEGVLVTLHTGTSQMVQDLKLDLTLGDWRGKEESGAGNVALHLVSRLQDRTKETIKEFERQILKLSDEFGASDQPIGKQTEILMGNMSRSLRYMNLMQSELVDSVGALIEASQRRHLSSMFDLGNGSDAKSLSLTTLGLSKIRSERINATLEYIRDLRERNDSRVIEITRRQAELTAEHNRKTMEEAVSARDRTERFFAMISALMGLASPLVLGGEMAQVYPESRDMILLWSGFGSVLLVAIGSYSGAINWKRIFKSSE